MDKADRILRDMKYARIIEIIAEKQNISLEDAMSMLYSSPLFEIIDDGTADLICRSAQATDPRGLLRPPCQHPGRHHLVLSNVQHLLRPLPHSLPRPLILI